MLARTACVNERIVIIVHRQQILDRRPHHIHDRAQIARLILLRPPQLLQCRLDGAASRMTQDDHQSRAELFRGEFDAADLRRRDDIAGDPDDEQISEALIEDDFHGHSRIGAAEDRGEGLLPRGQFDASGAARQCAATADVCDKTTVSSSQQSERVSSRYHRRLPGPTGRAPCLAAARGVPGSLWASTRTLCNIPPRQGSPGRVRPTAALMR